MEVLPGLHWVDQIWDTKVYLWVEDDGVVVIDAAMPGRATAVWRYLESLGYPPEAVQEIWLTHGDIDHIGNVAALKAGSGAKVVAHHGDVPLVGGQAARAVRAGPLTGGLEKAFNWAIRRLFAYQPVLVDRPVEDGDLLGDWQVVHTPGHTPGSACYYHPDRGILIVGDALNHRRGRLGAPPALFSYDMAQAHASIQKIAALDFEVCCFGHGPPLVEKAGERVRAFAHALQSAGE
ncbi:MAG: MBL fold metallo-hydrolase [Anaerolineae bacterium]